MWGLVKDNNEYILQVYKSIKRELEGFLICPDDKELEKEVLEKYQDFLKDIPENIKEKFITIFGEGIRYSHLVCIWQDICNNLNNGNKKKLGEHIKNTIKTYYKVIVDIHSLYNEFKNEGTNSRITLKDVIGYIGYSHGIGYDLAKIALKKIKEGQLTYAEAVWSTSEVLGRLGRSVQWEVII